MSYSLPIILVLLLYYVIRPAPSGNPPSIFPTLDDYIEFEPTPDDDFSIEKYENPDKVTVIK